MSYYLVNLLIFILVVIIGTYLFGLKGVSWTLTATLATTFLARLILKKFHRRQYHEVWAAVAFLAVMITTGVSLLATGRAYRTEVAAESLLNDRGITKVTLTIKPAPKDRHSPPPHPTKPPHPAGESSSSLLDRSLNWLKSLVAVLGF